MAFVVQSKLMKRRPFVAGAAALSLSASSSAAQSRPGRAILELRRIQLRNGAELQRTTDFFGKHFLPAAQRAGIGPMGFFNAVIAEKAPFVLAVLSYPSLAAMETATEKLAADKEFSKAFDDYNSLTELSYDRMESSLLRAFRTIPTIEVPDTQGRTSPRIFELRTYESNNWKAGQRKIAMFDDDEIRIFRKTGLLPVFFGETIVGQNMPNLTYMLAFDSLAAREANWSRFVADPDWQKLRAKPELADALIVSNISNAILRPLPFSPIR